MCIRDRPTAGRAALVQASGQAFASLLWGLAAVTVLTALIVFLCLGRTEPKPAARQPSRIDTSTSPLNGVDR